MEFQVILMDTEDNINGGPSQQWIQFITLVDRIFQRLKKTSSTSLSSLSGGQYMNT